MTAEPLCERCLYLTDAMALACRAHYGFRRRPLDNSRGDDTSAAYGFTAALLLLIPDHTLRYVAKVLDAMGLGGTF